MNLQLKKPGFSGGFLTFKTAVKPLLFGTFARMGLCPKIFP